MTRQVHNPASRREKIKVTADIIEKSKRANSAHCMIAEAVRTCVPGAKGITVDLQAVRFSDPETGWRYSAFTPRHAQKAIIDFDQGITPQPFEFRFIPAQVNEMHGRRAPEGVLSRTPGKKKVKRVVSNQQTTIPWADDAPQTIVAETDKHLATIGTASTGTVDLPLAQGANPRGPMKGRTRTGPIPSVRTNDTRDRAGSRREFGIKAFRK